VRQLLSGEIWGKTPRWGRGPAVQAYAGALEEGEEGVEFWSFQPPDNVFGPINHWSTEGEYVRIDTSSETAKLTVAFVRVSAGLIEESKSP
jgi:hypothetical protein